MNTSTRDAARHQPPASGEEAPGVAERQSEGAAPPDAAADAGAANRGSPAAPVMKQFQKTKSESNGRT